ITRTVDPSTFANCVYVTSSGGGGTLTPQHLESADIGILPPNGAGRWDQTIGTSYVTQSTLNDHPHAPLDHAHVVSPSYQIQFSPGTWGAPSDLWRGDPVTVRINSGRLQVNDSGLRVVELSFAISPDNVETLTATVGQLPFRIHKKIASMLKRL